MPGKRLDTDIWPDNLKEVGAWMFFIGVIAGMLALWSANPFFLHQLGSTSLVGSSGASTVDATNTPSDVRTPTQEERLYLQSEDASYLGRIAREGSHEVGFCGYLNGKVLSPWLANTVKSSSESLEFSTKNCPGSDDPPAFIHTHPSGSMGLSMQDRSHFVANSYRYMCIIGGEIDADIGDQSDKILCYEKTSTTRGYHYDRVPIVIRS